MNTVRFSEVTLWPALAVGGGLFSFSLLKDNSMLTNTDYLRDIAEECGLNTFHNPNIWPDFLKSFHSYVIYCDRDGYSHREACESLGVMPNSMWGACLADCYRAILDEPELYY